MKYVAYCDQFPRLPTDLMVHVVLNRRLYRTADKCYTVKGPCHAETSAGTDSLGAPALGRSRHSAQSMKISKMGPVCFTVRLATNHMIAR